MIEQPLASRDKIVQKLKLLFVPFVIVAAVFIFTYTFLHWQFYLVHPSDIREEIIDMWVPLILPWVPVLIWLRRRIILLEVQSKKDNLAFLLHMIAAFTISISTIIAQKYIETASGKLTNLESIADINSVEATRYYSIKNHYADKYNICFKNTAVVSGKHKTTLTYHIYIACPLYDAQPANSYSVSPQSDDSTEVTEIIIPADSVKKNYTLVIGNPADTTEEIHADIFKPGTTLPKAWLCFEYKKAIDNKLSKTEKHNQWMTFYTDTYKDFYERNADSFVYTERLGNNDKRDRYKEAISNCNVPVKTENAIILTSNNEPFDERNGSKLGWIFGSLAIGAALFLLLILIRRFDEEKLKRFLKEW